MRLSNAYDFMEFWCSLLEISLVSEGQTIDRFCDKIKFCIYDERNGKHHRSHFHALINDKKVASIYLDNFEIDFLSSRIKQSDKKLIIKWVKENKEELMKIRQLESGEYELPFLGYSKNTFRRINENDYI